MISTPRPILVRKQFRGVNAVLLNLRHPIGHPHLSLQAENGATKILNNLRCSSLSAEHDCQLCFLVTLDFSNEKLPFTSLCETFRLASWRLSSTDHRSKKLIQFIPVLHCAYLPHFLQREQRQPWANGCFRFLPFRNHWKEVGLRDHVRTAALPLK